MATKTRAALALWANKKSIENFLNKVNKHKKKTKKLHAITNCCDDVKVLPKGIKTAPDFHPGLLLKTFATQHLRHLA